MARINIVKEEDQFLCNISLRLIVPCFSMVMDCNIIQEVKGLTKKLYFIVLSRRKICNISLRLIVHLILHGYMLQYNTRSKRITKKLYFVLLSRRKTSYYAKFQVHC